jgi:mono/diheme cytochrome c family protein
LFALSAAALGLGADSSKPAIYQAAQAAAGAKLYDTNCSSCHGDRLEGGVGPALSGATLGTLAKNTKLTIGDMFSFLSLQMPLNEPASLKHDQYVDIMAYILKFNGYPAGSKPLTYSGATTSKVRMSPASGK